MAEGAVVPEDMRVTHFLIQPDPEGVKLQGWNERAFSKWVAVSVRCNIISPLYSVCITCNVCMKIYRKMYIDTYVHVACFHCLPAESLAEFIAHHTVEKLCLPCTLVLPKTGPGGEGGRGRGGGGDGGEGGAALQVRRRPVTMEEALKTGAGKPLA